MDELEKFFKQKNKFLIGLIITTVTGFLLQLFGFIWEYAWLLNLVAGFLGGFLVKSGGKSFLVGFLGIICSWGIYFIIWAFQGPFLTFANIIASIMGLGDLGVIIIFMALLIGGILGGLGGLNGYFVSIFVYGQEQS